MRARDVIAVTAGLAVVGAVAFAGWQALDRVLGDAAEPDPERDPATVADAYLDAWEADDRDAMVGLLRDEVEGFEAAHDQLLEALEPAEVTIERGGIEEPVDGRALATVAVRLQLEPPLDEVSWETRLELLRQRGQWEVAWSHATIHPELRPMWGFGTTAVEIDREPILAADGTPLAGGEAATVGFVAGQVQDPDDVIDAFADALPGSEGAAARELGRDELVDDWFYPVATLEATRAERAWEELRDTPGIAPPRSTGDDRVLLDVGFAEHLVGVVAAPTAEQLEERPELEEGEEIGQFGLEAAFEEQLLGSDREQVGLRELGTQGELEQVIAEGQREPSAPVRTTIDVTVQRAIEDALDGVDETAAIVAIDAGDGRIVGSASRPLGGFDRALAGNYPPGSTFKVITAEAALADGLDLDDEVACPGEASVGGLGVTNAGGLELGATTFRESFAWSCNTTFGPLGVDLGAEAMTEAAERFGFGVEPDLPLSAAGGSFPEPADDAELGAAAFGQARVEASPLHMASVAAAVEAGAWHPPYLLADEGAGARQRLATGTPDRLRDLLLAAVDDGTGTAADVDGEVGGKTGTAQTADGPDHAWFIGTVDGLGFAVLVEGGGSGSEIAAPIAGRFASSLLELRAGGGDDAAPEDDPDDPDDG